MDSSNWLDKNKRIMVGGKPRNKHDIQSLLNKNISVIVNLTTNREIKTSMNFQYQSILPSHVQCIHFPIKDMSVQPDNITLQLIDKIVHLSETEKHNIYIHCKGGHGRAGVIGGLIVHKLYPDLNYRQVIEYIQSQHRTRNYKPNAQTPQTASQYNQLHRIIESSDDIFFYDKNDPYYVFSNFYTQPKCIPLFIDKDSREWYSSEAYYQAHKFIGVSPDGDAYAEIIRNTTSSHFAYVLGNQGGNIRPTWKIDGVPITKIIEQFKSRITLSDEWDKKKETIMREAILYKFIQNINLKNLLVDSGINRLVEYSPRDSFWGTYWNKLGENRLGKLLESVRYEININQNT